MQPRTVHWQSGYRPGAVPGIVYASLRHCDEREDPNVQETTLTEPKQYEDEAENMMKCQNSIYDSSNVCRSEVKILCTVQWPFETGRRRQLLHCKLVGLVN